MAIIQPELTNTYPIYAVDGAIINLSIEQIKNLVTATSGSYKLFYLSPRNANCYSIVTQNGNTITDVDKAYFADNSYLNITGDYADVLGISPNFQTNSGSTLDVWYYQYRSNSLWSNTTIYWSTTRKEVDNINYYCNTSTTNNRPYVIYYWGSGEVYINGQLPPTYTWQSVPSISGKNGILQNLVQIKDSAINSGEPVNNAPLTSFDSLGNINIPSIIDEQMPVDPSNPTSVTITYLIPVLEYGSYSYIKVAIKKNSIPLSLEDADRVIDLDEPATITRIGSATVSGLDELSHYYFVIFIEDEQGNIASSEPQDIITGIVLGIFKTTISVKQITE